MAKTSSRIVTLIMAIVMLVCAVPLSVFASIPNWEEDNVVFEGTSFGTNG